MPRAGEFDPSRWGSSPADGAATAAPTNAGLAPLLPASSVKRLSMLFGAGPRICPGRDLAMLEMKLALATLLGRFDIQIVDTADGQPAREHLAFSMAPVGVTMRLKMRPTPRG